MPPLDRSVVDEQALTPEQLAWRRDGIVIVDDAVPAEALEAYADWRARRRLPDAFGAIPLSYGYMYVRELQRIALSRKVFDVMRSLLQEDLVAHFDLTQWHSTERRWHQDDYLNDEKVNGHYAAVWYAVDDIHPDAGPFQFVRGSNRWPVMRRGRIKSRLDPVSAAPDRWAEASQEWVGESFEREMKRRGAQPEAFIAKPGQALIWHARLVHRGSMPKNPALARKSVICHYTGMSKIEPDAHQIRYTDEGVPYIFHKTLAFKDWPSETGVLPFEPINLV